MSVGARAGLTIALSALSALTATGLTATAEAQGSRAALVEAHGPLLRDCYGAAAGPAARRACIGRMTEACVAATTGGGATLGMVSCAMAEHQVWDDFLNAEYAAARDVLGRMDDDDSAHSPEFAKRRTSLRDAQRAWIAFRDAECALAYAMWGAGSMRQTAGAGCLMRLTAERAIDLSALHSVP